MAYKLERIEDEEMADHLKKMKWLEEAGSYNQSPSPMVAIPQQVYIDVIRQQLPSYIESRQLLDQLCIEQPFRKAIIYWFEDCGIMMILPEILDDKHESISPEEAYKFVGYIQYYWIGCRHVYDIQEIQRFSREKSKIRSKIKVCHLCLYVEEIPIIA